MNRSLVLIVLWLAACSPSTEGEISAPPDDSYRDPVVRTAAEYLALSAFRGADRDRGEILSFACQACHTLGDGDDVLLGPNLFGIFGRAAATAPDFEYSDAIRRADIVWTPATLDDWLASPSTYLPGNAMVFAGYSNVSDRRDLIAFLLHKTGGLGD